MMTNVHIVAIADKGHTDRDNDDGEVHCRQWQRYVYRALSTSVTNTDIDDDRYA